VYAGWASVCGLGEWQTAGWRVAVPTGWESAGSAGVWCYKLGMTQPPSDMCAYGWGDGSL